MQGLTLMRENPRICNVFLHEAGISYDLEKTIEGAQDSAVAGTQLCLGEYKATMAAEPIECAIKIRRVDVAGLQVEAALMMSSSARHPNICNMYRAAVSGDRHYLAMELCQTTVQQAIQAGSLQTLLGTTTIVEMLRCLVEGVGSLHDSGFVKRFVDQSGAWAWV